MKKCVSIRIEDDIAVKHLHRVWSMLDMYCKFLVMFQEINEDYKIYVSDESSREWGGIRLSAEISTLKESDLQYFAALRRHCMDLGVTDVSLINHLY